MFLRKADKGKPQDHQNMLHMESDETTFSSLISFRERVLNPFFLEGSFLWIILPKKRGATAVFEMVKMMLVPSCKMVKITISYPPLKMVVVP